MRDIMAAELDECGWSCSCGEPRYKGEPCVCCRMAAVVMKKPVCVMFIRSLEETEERNG
jgi:hypothetical protein